MNQTVLFEDVFQISGLNEAGKKFERVNRLHGKGTTFDIDLLLDVNAELFECSPGDRVQVLLASSLTGGVDDGSYNPNNLNSALAESYDYIMHGRVFVIKHIENQRVELQASFGGLLLRLHGEQAHLDSFAVDNTFYILMRNNGGGAMLY